MKLRAKCVITAGILAAAAGGPVFGQASFFEDFEDIGPPSYAVPSTLTQRGWIFRNQSQPLGSRSWFSGITTEINPIYFHAQGGVRYLASDEGATSQASGGQISTWAILPAVQGQQAGDQVRVYARKLGGNATLEIRYSPNGATGTGSGATGVGDFTQVLLSATDLSSGGWTAYQTNVPGSGRIAIRHIGVWQGPGHFSPYVGIDSVSVGAPPPPPCNQPPIPLPGQTVTWTAAGGPYNICENIGIPAGATVNIEPGTVINFDTTRQLAVFGTLNINGMPASPVTLSRGGDYVPPYILVDGGTISAQHTNFRQMLRVDGVQANAHLTDCTFSLGGRLEIASAFASLERCSFINAYSNFSSANAIVKDCAWSGTQNFWLLGHTDFRGTNTIEDQPLWVLGSSHLILQPFPISNVHVRNVTQDVGLRIHAGKFYIGDNVILENNLYPISTQGAILPGSAVPTTGNIHNAIDVQDAFMYGETRWPDFGIPYRVTVPNNPGGPTTGGNIYIDPGVTVEHLSLNTIVAIVSGQLMMMGEPDRPIRLVPAPGNAAHHGPVFWSTPNSRLQYVEAEGMTSGITLRGGSSPLWIENSVLQNNQRAIDVVGFYPVARVSGTRFLNNGVGARGDTELNTPSNPNSFAGNGLALFVPSEWQMDARNVWWNSPTGPQHFSNPGGSGEVIGGDQSNVTVIPFLTQPPSYANHPPIVRSLLHPGAQGNQRADLDRTPPTTVDGTKYILQWQAYDDDQIVSQRVVLYWWPLGSNTFQEIVLGENLPGTQRSLEFTVPDIGQNLSGLHYRIVIYATDSHGKTGWDQVFMDIPSRTLEGLGHITFDDSHVAGQVFHPRHDPPQASFTNSYPWGYTVEASVVYEADDASQIGYVSSQYLFYDLWALPWISTDRARVVFRVRANNNDYKLYHGNYFSIRPDPRLGWEPPQVQMTSPVQGQSFPGGGIIPIAWTASAQQGVYGFDIQSSYDGGKNWHTIAHQLDAQDRSYDWQLPPSTGISDVRVRIIVRDKKMQNSAHGDDRTFAITPGSGPSPCYANCDGSTTAPVLNVADFTCFLQKFAAADPYANCDQSTAPPVLNVADFTCFLTKFAAGCP
jgi:hypothetical protein